MKKSLIFSLFVLWVNIFPQSHFVPVWSGNPYMPMSIFITSATIDGIPLEINDEIAAFDGDLCVGVVVLPEGGIESPFSSIVCSNWDAGNDGYISGHSISLKIWDASTQEEIDNTVLAYFDCGTGTPSGPQTYQQLGQVCLYVEGFSNQPPVAEPIFVSTLEDQSVEIELIAYDPEGDAIIYEILSVPQHGSLSGDSPFLLYSPDQNYFGGDNFSYCAFDGYLYSEPAVVTIQIAPVNDPPIAFSSQITTDEDVPVGIELSVEDVDSDNFTLTIQEGPFHGFFEGGIYQPEGNYFGEDWFTFTAFDGEFESNLARVDLQILPVNDQPVITGQTEELITPEDLPTKILMNAVSVVDVDSDFPDMFTMSILPGENYTVLNHRIFPASNFFGNLSVGVVVSDGAATSEPFYLDVYVFPVNDPPVIEEIDDVFINEDASIEIALSAGDVENDPLIFSAESDNNAVLTEIVENVLNISPISNFHGESVVIAMVNDGNGGLDWTEFVLTVYAVNDVPSVENLMIYTEEDTPVEITLEGLDVDSDALSFSVVTPPQHGVLEGNTYFPNANFNGEDNFTYSASDGIAESESATVTIIVTPVNDSPVAENVFLSTNEDESFEISFAGSDVDGDVLTYELTTEPTHGVFDGANYFPDENYFGEDIFQYIAADGSNASSQTAVVTIEIIPVNDPPVVSAGEIFFEMYEDTPFEIPLMEHVFDVEGSNLVYSLIDSDVAGGVLEELIYTPRADFFTGGTSEPAAYFTFEISDGDLSSFITVFITQIFPINDPPQFITEEIATATEGQLYSQIILVEDVDDDLGGLTLTILMAPAWLEINGFELIGMPLPNNLAENANVRLSLNDGEFVAIQNYEIEVTSVNDPPTVESFNVVCYEDNPREIALSATDQESNVLGFFIVTPPAHGTLWQQQSDAEQNVFVFHPDENYNGSDSFTYVAFDGENYSEPGTVSLDIYPINDPPEISVVPQNIEMMEDSIVEIGVEGSDVDGDLIEIQIVEYPEDGTIDGNVGTGTFTYTPNPDFYGHDAIMLVAVETNTNDFLHSPPVFVQIAVLPQNDPPTAQDIEISLLEDTGIMIHLFGDDEDNSSSMLDVWTISEPSHGSLTQHGQANFRYIPNENYNGIDQFEYVASDGNLTDTATVIITVEPVNDPPVLVNMENHNFIHFNNVTSGSEFFLGEHFEDLDGDSLSVHFITIQGHETVFGGTIEILPNDYIRYTFSHQRSFDLAFFRVTDGFSQTRIGKIKFHIPRGEGEPMRAAAMSLGQTIQIMEEENHQMTLIGIDVGYDFPEDPPFPSMDVPQIGEIIDSTWSLVLSDGPIAEWTVVYSAGDIDDLLFCDRTSRESITDSVYYSITNPNNTADPVSAPALLEVTIFNVNDSPTIEPISSQTTDEDSNFSLPIFFEDPDNDLTLSSSSTEQDNIAITFASVTDTSADMLISLSPNFYGDALISVAVQEDGGDTLLVSSDFYLTVSNVNDPPVVMVSDQATVEDNEFEMLLGASDVDGTVDFTFAASVEVNPGLISVSVVGDTLIIVPAENQTGQATISVIASDGEEYSEPVTFNFTVQNINDPPAIAIIDSQAVEEDATLVMEIQSVDIDSELLIYSAMCSEEDIIVSFLENILTIAPSQNWNGTATIQIQVSDGEMFDAEEFQITVNPINDAPVLSEIAAVEFDEDGSTAIILSAEDVDFVSLDFEATSTENITSAVVGNIVMFSGNPDFYGTDTVIISVFDNENANDFQEVTINVLPMNDAPVLEPIDLQTVNEDSTLVIYLSASDVDNSDLVFVATTEEENITTSILENVLTIAPAQNWNGSAIITVSVNDQVGRLVDEETFVFTANPINDAPNSENISISTPEDTPVEIVFSASDVDGDILTYIVVDSVSNGVFESGFFYPESDFFGYDMLTYQAFDGELYSDISTVEIIIESVNDAPIFAPIEDQSMNEDESLVVSFFVEDIDNENLTFGASTGNEFVTIIFDDTMMQMTIVPNENWFGTVEVTVTADDEMARTIGSETFQLVVNPINDAPVQIGQFSHATVLMNSQAFIFQNLDDIFYDVEDDFNYTIENDNDSLLQVTMDLDHNVYVSPSPNQTGTANLTFIADDGEFVLSGESVITVVESNGAPVVSAPTVDISVDEDSESIVVANLSDIFSDPEGAPLNFNWNNNNESLLAVEIDFERWIILTFLENQYGTAEIVLEASDGLESIIDTLFVSVNSVNDLPVAHAGENQIVYADVTDFAEIILDGSASYDIEGEIANYLWSCGENFYDGATVVISLPRGELYEILLTVLDADGGESTDAITVLVPYFTPAHEGGSVYNPMLFSFTGATLDTINLQPHDEIAIFDGDLCVGHGVVESEISIEVPLEVQSSMDSGSGNGFIAGNDASLKIWDQNEKLEITDISALYVSNGGESFTSVQFEPNGHYSVTVEAISRVTQVIPLSAGWNIFSAFTIPNNPDLLSIVQPLIDGGVLTTVIDESGARIQEFMGSWINGIGDFEFSEGYYIKTTGDIDLVVEGVRAECPAPVQLGAGWNIVGYPLSRPQDAMSAVQPLIDAGLLITVINESGARIQEFMGSWINGIGNFDAGEGYYIKVSGEIEWFLDEGEAAKASVASSNPVRGVHFEPIYSGNPFKPMGIYIVDAFIDGNIMEDGDEIALFDGKHCVGSSLVTEEIVTGDFWIVASQDDGETSGFAEHNPIAVKVWDCSEEMEIRNVEVQWLGKDGEEISAPAFEGLGAAFARINSTNIPSDFELSQNYPNPFNPETVIEFAIPEETHVKMVIYDVLGREVSTLIDKKLKANYHSVKWGGLNQYGKQVSSGIYFYRIQTASFHQAKKMVFIR